MTVYVAIYTFETNYKCVVYFVLSSFSFLNCPEIRNFWISKELSFSSLRNTMTLLKVLKKTKTKPKKQGGMGEERWLHGLKIAANSFPLFLLSDGSTSPPLESGLALWPSGHSNVTQVTQYNL